jgi:hypothetical protein
MDQNPYRSPNKSDALPRRWSPWANVLVAGALLVGTGIIAVLAAHAFAPRQYAFVAIALTEKIVLLGLVVSLIGGAGWGVSRMIAP